MSPRTEDDSEPDVMNVGFLHWQTDSHAPVEPEVRQFGPSPLSSRVSSNESRRPASSTTGAASSGASTGTSGSSDRRARYWLQVRGKNYC